MSTEWTPFEAQPLAMIKLPGLGPKSLEKLAAAQVHTVGDLLGWVPRAYLDFSKVTPIGQAPLDVPLHIQGRVLQKHFSVTPRTRTRILEILVDDGSGTMRALWFNQAWMKDAVEKGQMVSLYGKVRFEQLGRTLNSPKLKVLTGGEETEAVEPVYRQMGEVRAQRLRAWILAALAQMPDPDEHAGPPDLPGRKQALTELHQPTDGAVAAAIEAGDHPAVKRLIFDEFLAFQRRLQQIMRTRTEGDYARIPDAARLLVPFRERLPFTLTPDQAAVVTGLVDTLAAGGRLHAMIQGDVGCGKTVVGLLAAAVFAAAGAQSALLCPTSVLARQHYHTATDLLAPHGIRVILLSARMDAEARRAALSETASGAAQLVIGTHRLLQKDVHFARLDLVLIDEQHRFGVDQRAALLKKGRRPHYLAFSATPIPRSLAMTVHGDYQVWQIRQKPAGRLPVLTRLKKSANRDEVVQYARYRAGLGEGVFWVFPLIDNGSDGEEDARAYRSAQATYEAFRDGVLPDVGLVHGRMSGEEIAAQTEAFRNGTIKVLVATTVIEVGIDIPTASMIVIEGAERFGLSQLHQLRGRVGRGGGEAFCFLVTGPGLTRDGLARLQVLCDCDDGFDIAEWDLRRRGAGDLLGKQQSGLPPFRYGDPWKDRDIMAWARETALLETKGDTSPCG